MKINTESNGFTYLFASVMVIIVAVMLTGIQSVLKPRQAENQRLEKMQFILSAIDISVERKEAEEAYKKYIVEEVVLDVAGNKVNGVKAFDIDLKREAKKEKSQQQFPLFLAEKSGKKLSVIPMRGVGLWGPITGYFSIADDGSTISGARFDHEKETPGLGAEITQPFFYEQFVGKKIFSETFDFKSVKVLKGGGRGNSNHEVDAITGATITSVGVSEMLEETFVNYVSYFKNF